MFPQPHQLAGLNQRIRLAFGIVMMAPARALMSNAAVGKRTSIVLIEDADLGSHTSPSRRLVPRSRRAGSAMQKQADERLSSDLDCRNRSQLHPKSVSSSYARPVIVVLSGRACTSPRPPLCPMPLQSADRAYLPGKPFPESCVA